jgi:hypothetical protein
MLPNCENIVAMLTNKVPTKKKKPEVVVIQARIVPIEKILPLLKKASKKH